MSDNLISIIDFAHEHGVHKATVFKIVDRLKIEKVMRCSANNSSKGQKIAYITIEDAKLILEHLPRKDGDENTTEDTEERGCVFYLLLLEPNHDPGRFKVGIADSLPERLRKHRCSAPLLTVVNTWPCKRLWENTAIDCVTEGCEKLSKEVFRTKSIESVVERCKRFFELMPKPPSS